MYLTDCVEYGIYNLEYGDKKVLPNGKILKEVNLKELNYELFFL